MKEVKESERKKGRARYCVVELKVWESKEFLPLS